MTPEVYGHTRGIYCSRTVRRSPKVRTRAKRYRWVFTLHDRDDRVGDQFWLRARACKTAWWCKPGHIAPVSAGELKNMAWLIEVFTHFPDRAGYKPADRLLPAQTNNAVIVSARKRSDMRVLITGAGGFIGSHLVDSQLEQEHYVRAVDIHLDLLEASGRASSSTSD